MSPTAIGLFLIFIVSLPKVSCEDNDQNLMVSDDKYLSTIVSFWEKIPEGGKRVLLCLGALSGSSMIFIKKTCHELLKESNNMVICTGSSYFDDFDMHFIIKGTIDFVGNTHFILLLLTVNIERPSSLTLNNVLLKANENYRGVLVGWSVEKDQPMIELFTFSIRGHQMRMSEHDNNKLSAKDFPLGSLAVRYGEVIAVSYVDNNQKIQFSKILEEESEKVASVLLDSLNGRDPHIVNIRKTEIKPEDYTNILVSLWKIISKQVYYILCLGALIKSNLIFTTTQCSNKLESLSEVGVLTGINNITDFPEQIQYSEQPLRENSEFSILIDGLKNIRSNFKNNKRFLMLLGAACYKDEDFPLSSLAIKGRNIIGFTYLDEKNDVNGNSIVGEIRTIDKRKVVFSKINYADFTAVNSLLRKGREMSPVEEMSRGKDEGKDLVVSDDKYLNTIVSFWKIIPEQGKRVLLCLGALSGSNLIFIIKTCYDSLRETNNIVICTGSSYFDDFDMNFIIEDTKEFYEDTHFIVLILKVNTERPSSLAIEHVVLNQDVKYRGVLVGWSERKNHPMIEPFTFVIRGCKMMISEDGIILNVKDFPPGSLVVRNGQIIAVSYVNINQKIRFNKILEKESKGVQQILSDPSINKSDPHIENKRKTAIVPKDYINILVSLWEIISEKEYNILCLGALITSYLVFITTQCSDQLEPLSEVGVLTGINDITDCPDTILYSKQRLREYSKFSILILDREINLPSSVRIGVVTTGIDETDKSGVILGWNKMVKIYGCMEKDKLFIIANIICCSPEFVLITVYMTGRKNKPFIFKNEKNFLSLNGAHMYSSEDYPLGSIAIKGKNIIGFTHLDKKSIVRGIRTNGRSKIQFTKIVYADFMKINFLLDDDSAGDDGLTKNDYFNFVVSLWKHKSPFENNFKSFEFLCLGAIIYSKWILINHDCSQKVPKVDLDKFGVLTYSMFLKKLIPKTGVFDHSHRIRKNDSRESKYYILYLNSHFDVSSRIKVDWAKWDDGENYGILVGWDKEKGPVKQSFHMLCKQRLCIPLGDLKRPVSCYPLGSLIIIGQKLRASVYFEKRTGATKDNGLASKETKISDYCIPAYKLIDRDSSALKTMLLEEAGPEITYEMGLSSKKPRL